MAESGAGGKGLGYIYAPLLQDKDLWEANQRAREEDHDVAQGGGAGRGKTAALVLPEWPKAEPAPSTGTNSPLPEGTAREQYIYAQSLIRKKSYANAEQAFRAFLDANPDNRLAPNAHYWIGETLYVRQKYEDAARVFLAGYQRYPKSSKAFDSLLKLGLTLSRLGQAGEACTTFDELLARLPENERRLRPKAELERRNARCQ